MSEQYKKDLLQLLRKIAKIDLHISDLEGISSNALFSLSDIFEKKDSANEVSQISLQESLESNSEYSRNELVKIPKTNSISTSSISDENASEAESINKKSRKFPSREKRQVKVFISYSHDSEQHKKNVRNISKKLRDKGIDCIIDVYEELALKERWTRWMERNIEDADFVIVVCTEEYNQRLKDGMGGSSWEGAIIKQEIYDAQKQKVMKFIPILFSQQNKQHIPSFLKDVNRYILSLDNNQEYEKNFENLYRHITQQPRYLKPELGELCILPPEE